MTPRPPGGLLGALAVEIAEAGRAADEASRLPNPDGHLLEFALLPDRIELTFPVAVSDDGEVAVPNRSRRATGEALIRWRRLQTPESVRAEIDDANELDHLVRDGTKARRLRQRVEGVPGE